MKDGIYPFDFPNFKARIWWSWKFNLNISANLRDILSTWKYFVEIARQISLLPRETFLNASLALCIQYSVRLRFYHHRLNSRQTKNIFLEFGARYLYAPSPLVPMSKSICFKSLTKWRRQQRRRQQRRRRCIEYQDEYNLLGIFFM